MQIDAGYFKNLHSNAFMSLKGKEQEDKILDIQRQFKDYLRKKCDLNDKQFEILYNYGKSSSYIQFENNFNKYMKIYKEVKENEKVD